MKHKERTARVTARADGCSISEQNFMIAGCSRRAWKGAGRLLVVGNAGVTARRPGMHMQSAFDRRTEFLDHVADHHFAHLLMSELHSLHQGTVLPVRIPVGRDDSRSISSGDLRHVEG